MKENRKKAIKQEDKKSFLSFLILIGVSFLVGGMIGFFGGGIFSSDKFDSEHFFMWFRELQFDMGIYAVGLMLCLVVVNLLFGTMNYLKNRKRFAAWDGESEEEFNKIDYSLNWGIMFTNMTLILSMVLFGIAFYVMGSTDHSFTYMIVTIVTFVFGTFSCVVLQKAVINLAKEMCPEKQGSFYDMNFKKKWMESCDEAERLLIYQCAYRSFGVINGVCSTMVVLLLLIGMFLEIGILPLITVGIIWLILNLSYLFEAQKLGKYGMKKDQ